MLDGFQYLEERDASDKITRAGVVSKKSAFVSPENAGIYDAIAKDLRLLAEAATSLADDADLQRILTQVKSMYDDMRTNPNFGSTAAHAAAEEALKQAQAAATSAASAKEYGDKAASVASAITAVENYLKTINGLQSKVSDSTQVAVNNAADAKKSAEEAATSASAASESAVSAKKYGDEAVSTASRLDEMQECLKSLDSLQKKAEETYRAMRYDIVGPPPEYMNVANFIVGAGPEAMVSS